ncbi:MAG: hypothetical protein KDA86_20590 [Planctomycetaceae bacterium]|nr:hypothetical protein [Planctomycetaceae bacterium]
MPLPTIIVVHPKEKRSKCSVEPLRGREDFIFWKYPHRGTETLKSYVRLGLGGPELSAADADLGLLVLDGTWRLAGKMEDDYADVPVRTLPPWETAYPRTSKLFDDPLGGLATIEAVFAAFTILGRDVTGLLDEYHWGEEFLERNAERLWPSV